MKKKTQTIADSQTTNLSEPSTLETARLKKHIPAEKSASKQQRDQRGRFMPGNSLRFTPGHHTTTEFKPGQSGNPGGLTKEQICCKEEIKKFTPRAVEVLNEILEDQETPPAVRLRACEIVFDRTFGKPTTAVKVPTINTVEESRAYLMALVEKIKESNQ